MKLARYFVPVLISAVVSCDREDRTPVDTDIRYLCFDIPTLSTDGNITAASLARDGMTFAWEETDTVGLFTDKGFQSFVSIAQGAGSDHAVIDGNGWALKSSTACYGYFPFVGDIYLEKEKIPVNFLGQSQNRPDNCDNIRDYMYMTSIGAAIGENMTFSFKHLCSFLSLSFSAPEGTYRSLTLSLNESLWITSGYYSVKDGSPAIKGQTFSDSFAIELENFVIDDASKKHTVNMAVAPVNLAGKRMTITLESADGGKYIYEITPGGPFLAGVRHLIDSKDYKSVKTIPNSDSLQQALSEGATTIEVSEIPTGDVSLDLTSIPDDISVEFPSEESQVEIAVCYQEESESYPSTLNIIPPVNSSLDINTPKSTVTVEKALVKEMKSRTAKNTLIIKSSSHVEHILVLKGNVVNNGVVDTLDFSALEEDITVLNYGKIGLVTGVDDDWNTSTGYHVTLYEASGSSIGVNESATPLVLCGEYDSHSEGMLYCASVYRSPKNSKIWEKYAHGVFDTPSEIKIDTDVYHKYRVEVQCVVNGVDSLYHYNDLYDGSTGKALYYGRGHKLNEFVYHNENNMDDDYYDSVRYGRTWYSSNSFSDNSVLKIYYGSTIIDGSGIGESIQVPLYYARYGVKIQCHGISSPDASVLVTIKGHSECSGTLTKENDSFYAERSMYDLESMVSGINNGENPSERVSLTLKYVKKTEDAVFDRYIMKERYYDLPRNQVTTFDVTVNDDGVGEDGFTVNFESTGLEGGRSYDFSGTIEG